MSADIIASNIFQSIGFDASTESLSTSFLGASGALDTGQSLLENWKNVSVQYHFEEALALRSIIIEMEYRCQLISKIATLTASAKKEDTSFRNITAADIASRMSVQALLIARNRALTAGNNIPLSNDEASLIHNERAGEYGALVKRSVLSDEPIPTGKFQLGLPRNHPGTDLLVRISAHACSALGIDEKIWMEQDHSPQI